MKSFDAPASLIQLQPRHATNETSQGRVVLVASREGTIADGEPDQGLWVYQTRMLSRYRWLMEGQPAGVERVVEYRAAHLAGLLHPVATQLRTDPGWRVRSAAGDD